jgi:hypothetical protein
VCGDHAGGAGRIAPGEGAHRRKQGLLKCYPLSSYNPGVLYLIDASVPVFRACQPMPPDMTDRDGNPVRALFGLAHAAAASTAALLD